MREKPACPGHSRVSRGVWKNARASGWRRSADRTRLQAKSLLTGNFTGKIAISGLPETVPEQQTAVSQWLFAIFPTQINRETISKNREFLVGIREHNPQTLPDITRRVAMFGKNKSRPNPEETSVREIDAYGGRATTARTQGALSAWRPKSCSPSIAATTRSRRSMLYGLPIPSSRLSRKDGISFWPPGKSLPTRFLRNLL